LKSPGRGSVTLRFTAEKKVPFNEESHKTGVPGRSHGDAQVVLICQHCLNRFSAPPVNRPGGGGVKAEPPAAMPGPCRQKIFLRVLLLTRHACNIRRLERT